MKEADGIKKSIEEIIGNDTVLKEKRRTKEDIQREKFEKAVTILEGINGRANILGNDLRIDLSSYDESFYQVIDELFDLLYGKEAGEIIFFYLYERVNPDGSINQLEDENDNRVTLMSPTDLWYIIKEMNAKLEKKEKKLAKKIMKPKPYSKTQIETAMRYTKSVRAASKYLGCSYQHLKPWMKLYRVDENDPESPTLFEVHKNPHGKGIPKFLPNKRKEPNVKIIFTENHGWESFTPDKIKARGVAEGYLRDECYRCGFCERRVTDYKIPLLLSFKDGNKCNYLIDNLEQLCYNCYYLNVGEVLTPNQIRHVEDNLEVKDKPFEWDLDAEQMENMRALGILE